MLVMVAALVFSVDEDHKAGQNTVLTTTCYCLRINLPLNCGDLKGVASILICLAYYLSCVSQCFFCMVDLLTLDI